MREYFSRIKLDMQPCKLLLVALPRYIIGLLVLVITLALSSSFVFAAPSDETTYYFLNDNLGSVEVVLNDTGSLVERRDYLPYGLERHVHEELDAPITTHGFTGKELDDETGLNYYDARYYDAVIGKFLSIDPVVLNAGWTSGQTLLNSLSNPQLLNAYGYAANNPLKYTDPTGEAILAISIDPTQVEGFAFGQRYNPVPLTPAEQYAISAIGMLATGGFTTSFQLPQIISDIKNAGQISSNFVSRIKTNQSTSATNSGSRYMSREELKVVKDTGMLRGGRTGDTYWTIAEYSDPKRAVQRLSLDRKPEVRLDFDMLNQPKIEGPSIVKPTAGTKGGGIEFSSSDPVHVKINNVKEY